MKTTTLFQLFLSVFVLALGTFAFYEYKDTQNEKKAKTEREQLLKGLKLDQVIAVRLFKEKEKMSIIKQKEDWLLLEPLPDRVSFTELSRWFNTIARHKVQALDIEHPLDSPYSIGETPRVEIDLKSGDTLTFSISSKKSFDERWFIKKSSQIFLAESGIDKELQNKNLEDFRSKKILPSLNHAIKIQIEKKEVLTLKWKDYKWRLEDKKESEPPLNQAFLNEFWNLLTNLSASSILESKKESKKYKLDTPLLTINLFYEQQKKNQKSNPEGEVKPLEKPLELKKYVLKISSPQQDKIYASISHRDYIFEIPKDKLKDLLLTREELFKPSSPTLSQDNKEENK